MRCTRRKKRRKHLVTPEVSLTPLIDTALTLLIIFMVATPMMQTVVKVNLPRGMSREDMKAQQDLVVYIDKQGVIFFENNEIKTKELLVEALQKKVKNSMDDVVFVMADEHASHGTVIRVVDYIKSVGEIKYVALAMERA
jgi:biopolymer transport protein ExbD